MTVTSVSTFWFISQLEWYLSIDFGQLRFIEGDFDAYVKRIQQPYVWGGEPELLMASHVLK